MPSEHQNVSRREFRIRGTQAAAGVKEGEQADQRPGQEVGIAGANGVDHPGERSPTEHAQVDG